MTNAEAIETLRANYPDACYEQLREAVDAAIEALKAQDAAGDTISRQFEEIVVEYPSFNNTYTEYKGKPYFSIKYTENGQEFIGYGTYNPEVLSRYLRDYFMPPAQPEPPCYLGSPCEYQNPDVVISQPEERTEERTETHACDSISRQDAIDEINEWIKAFRENGHKESAADACLIQDGIIQLPSAQPEKETPKRVLWSGWKGTRDTRYKCPNCKKPVRNTDIYCHRCGQKLMFPNISFTPYVEGQKQELIVRWDDE